MNKNTSIVLLGTVFAVTIGLMGTNGVFSMPTGISTSGTNYHESGGNLLGHVTLVATDPNGNIKEYRQMDNVVTTIGRTCTTAAVFGTAVTSGTAGCTPSTFQYIGIGTLSRTEVTTDTGLDSPILRTSLTGSEINPAIRTTLTITNSTQTTQTVGGIAVQSVSFLFGATTTVGEAVIQDSGLTTFGGSGAAAEHTFARKAITPTIGVNTGDTLTVTWTITTG